MNASQPFINIKTNISIIEHPPDQGGGKLSKRLGGNISCKESHELGCFLTPCPSSGERLLHGCTKFHFTVGEGEGRLNPSRDKIEGKHRRRKVDAKSCATFLLCDPGWCVHRSDVQNK